MTISTLLEYLDFHYEKTDMGYKLVDNSDYYHFDYLADTPEALIDFIPEAVIKDYFLSKETYGTDEDFETLKDALKWCAENEEEYYGELLKVVINPDLLDKEVLE